MPKEVRGVSASGLVEFTLGLRAGLKYGDLEDCLCKCLYTCDVACWGGDMLSSDELLSEVESELLLDDPPCDCGDPRTTGERCEGDKCACC